MPSGTWSEFLRNETRLAFDQSVGASPVRTKVGKNLGKSTLVHVTIERNVWRSAVTRCLTGLRRLPHHCLSDGPASLQSRGPVTIAFPLKRLKTLLNTPDEPLKSFTPLLKS